VPITTSSESLIDPLAPAAFAPRSRLCGLNCPVFAWWRSAPPVIICPEPRVQLSFPGPNMRNDTRSSLRTWFDHSALIIGFAVVALVSPIASESAEAPITLQVHAFHGLPGLNHSALCRFLAAHMAEAGLADWRFEPAEGDSAAPNRVEWTFKVNPYAGGEVRQFVREPVAEQGFGIHRPVTIEVRLYLNDQYQALVERQAMVRGGPNDTELAAAVASATESLLRPSGAYRAINMRQHPAPDAR
jgi:hypothetical protein